MSYGTVEWTDSETKGSFVTAEPAVEIVLHRSPKKPLALSSLLALSSHQLFTIQYIEIPYDL